MNKVMQEVILFVMSYIVVFLLYQIFIIRRAKTNNKKNKKSKSPEQVTNELVYYWMIALGIPFECERWHFNRLLTLIEVCNIKNEKPKNMSKKELYSRNTALNQLRRKQMNTHG